MTPTIALAGSYPRHEDLVKTTWNFDKKLVSADELDQQFLQAARDLVALQQRFGTATVTDGNLTWQDAFRGLVETSPAFEVGGVTRLFETNKFYRQPILKGTPSPNPGELAQRFFLLERLRPNAPKKAILPSPYWFAKAAKIETGQSVDDAGRTLAAYVNAVARWLEGLGYQQIQLNEPLLFHEKQPDLALAARLLETALAGLRSTTIANFPNGNAAPHWPWLQKLPSSTVGVDFVETHVEQLPAATKGRPLLAAVVDSQESLLETPKEVQTLVSAIQSRLQPAQLTLTHTWDLEFLPAAVAEKKLELLSPFVQRTVTA